MNWIVALGAALAAADLPQRVALFRSYPRTERAVIGAGVVAATVLLAAVATPVVDAFDISSPNLQIGAGTANVTDRVGLTDEAGNGWDLAGSADKSI